MKMLDLKDAATLAGVLRENPGEEVVLVRDGHAVALLVPFDDADLEWYGRERNPEFIDSIAQARQQVAARQTVSHDELKKRLGLG